jgi:hypothetical protein
MMEMAGLAMVPPPLWIASKLSVARTARSWAHYLQCIHVRECLGLLKPVARDPQRRRAAKTEQHSCWQICCLTSGVALRLNQNESMYPIHIFKSRRHTIIMAPFLSQHVGPRCVVSVNPCARGTRDGAAALKLTAAMQHTCRQTAPARAPCSRRAVYQARRQSSFAARQFLPRSYPACCAARPHLHQYMLRKAYGGCSLSNKRHMVPPVPA